jgi:hypothetical protein
MGSGDGELDPQGTTFDAPSPPRAPSSGDLDIGDRLGRYKLIGRIGGGAMGVVWRARDPKLDRDVAIKVVHPTLARIPNAAARLLREARALAKVQHSAVVAVHDAGTDDDRLFIAMELIEGTTLGAILRQRTPRDRRDWRGALARVVEAGRGLAAAHAAGVLHRDFKPDNVLVSAAGRVCVADFGLAEIHAGAATLPQRPSVVDAGDSWQASVSADSLTVTGAVVGTPLYMSPEQLRGGAVDARSDQFGFCVTAFEALYGARPFSCKPGPDQPPSAALLAEIEAGNILPAPRDAKVPRRVRDVIVRGLAAAPDARWPDMRALLAALTPQPRRWPWIVGAAAVVVAGAVIAVALAAPGSDGPRAVKLATLPMWSRVVSSADGRIVAYADDDRLYVRDVAVAASPLRGLPIGGPIDHIELESADRVVASIAMPDGLQLRRWYLASGAVEDVETLPGWSQWYGVLPGGRLVGRWRDGALELAMLAGERVELIATVPRRVQLIAIAPGGRRLAWVDDEGFRGTIVVRDLDRPGLVTGPPVDELSGVTWVSASRLVYSTGAGERPSLWAVELGPDGLGPATRIWTADLGWYGNLASAGGRIRFVDTETRFAVRWIDRGDQAASRELDPAIASDSLGWTRTGQALAWQRGSGRLVTLDVGAEVRADLTPARLDGDVGNATRAGDVVIASVRRPGGREIIAVSLVDGTRRWSRRPGDATVVRCAGDDHAPCVIASKGEGGAARLHVVDPDTGALGAELPAPARVEDVSIAPDGDEMIVCDGTANLSRMRLGQNAPQLEPYLTVPLVTCRSIAHDPVGGVLITGGRKAQLYQLLNVQADRREIVVAQSSSELLSVPRPSPDGRFIVVLARRFLPALYELRGVSADSAVAP